MALKRACDILKEAANAPSAVKCFECVNLEQIAWSIEAAEACNRPVLLMLYFDMDFYTPVDLFLAMAVPLARRAKVPVGLTYVYCDQFAPAMRAIQAGFPSICYNASCEDFEARVRETSEVVRCAHALGADVSANPGGEGLSAKQVSDFALRTGADAIIAPVVRECEGNNHAFTENRHWFPENRDRIDFDMLKAIHAATPVPLILHHAYNVPEEEIRRSLNLGVKQVDDGCPFDTAFYRAMERAITQTDCGDSYFAALLAAKEDMLCYLTEAIKSVS